MTDYECWLSHTCWVCQSISGYVIPNIHVSSQGYHSTSACDTVTEVVSAETDKEALSKFKKSDLYRRYVWVGDG